jgi:hypothetical protein
MNAKAQAQTVPRQYRKFGTPFLFFDTGVF